MDTRLVAICHNHHPGALGQYYERALRRDPALRDRYDLVTVGPSTAAHPTDVPYAGDCTLREAFDAAGRTRLPDILLYFDALPLVPLGLTDMPSVNVFMCSDWQKHFYWFMHMARLFDLVLTQWREAEDALRRVDVPEVRTLFWTGYDPEIFRPMDLPKAYDVTFVGMLDPRLCRYRGRAVERLIKLSDEGVRVNLMQGVWYEDVARAYSQSKIVFNKGWDNGFNARVIESMACGSMVLTHAVQGEDAALGFRDREHVVFYHNDAEIQDLVRYYIDHDEEREGIARAGRAAVADRFSYDTRARTVLDSIETWRTERSRPPDRLSSEETAYCEGIASAYAGKLEVAETMLRRSGQRDPRARNAVGAVVGRLGRREEAVRTLTDAAESAPGYAIALINRANVELDAGRPGQAAVSLSDAVTRLTDPAYASVDQSGLTFYTDYDAFKWEYEYSFIDHAGRDETGRIDRLRQNLLCRAYEMSGDVASVSDPGSAAAVEAYVNAVALRGDDGHLRFKLGRARLRFGDTVSGETELRRAVSMEPMFADAQEELYRLLRAQGRIEEAAELFRESLGANPLFRRDRAPACRELGDMYEQLGRLHDACVWWDASLALEREIPELREKLIRVCTELTDRALAAEPDRPRPTVALAQIARNEEMCIEASLRSIAGFVDDMVVLDTGSTDDTPEIAARCGARVVRVAWPEDFAAARNEAIRHVDTDWVVMLDADEVTSPECLAALDRYIRCGIWDAVQTYLMTYVADPRTVGFRPARDRVRSRGMPGYYLNPLVRVFRNRPGVQFEGRVHETILGSLLRAGGRIAHTAIEIDHYGLTKGPRSAVHKKSQYLSLCERNIAERPTDIKALLETGMQLRDLGEYDRAVEVFEQALKLNPYFVWVVAGLIETALIGGRHFGAARRAVEQFERTRPIDMPEVQINYAMLLMRLGETADARRRLETALAAAPENAVGHCVFGMLSEIENDTETADRAYVRALELVPEYTACRNRRAAMHTRLRVAEMLDRGDVVEGVRMLRAAIETDPGNELALNDLAVAFCNAGQTEEAAELLRRGVERRPWTEVVCRNFLDVMGMLDREDEAGRIIYEARDRMEGGHDG